MYRNPISRNIIAIVINAMETQNYFMKKGKAGVDMKKTTPIDVIIKKAYGDNFLWRMTPAETKEAILCIRQAFFDYVGIGDYNITLEVDRLFIELRRELEKIDLEVRRSER